MKTPFFILPLFVVSIVLICELEAEVLQPNQPVLDSIREGEAVIARLEALLSAPTVSRARKASFSRVISKQESAGSRGAPGQRGRSPDLFGCSPLMSKRCCKVIVPPTIRSMTRYVNDNSWYCRPCGRRDHRCNLAKRARPIDFDDYRCRRPVTYYVSVSRACPADKTSCCVGEIWYRTGCISIDELRRWLEYLTNGGNGFPPCTNPALTTRRPPPQLTTRRWPRLTTRRWPRDPCESRNRWKRRNRLREC